MDIKWDFFILSYYYFVIVGLRTFFYTILNRVMQKRINCSSLSKYFLANKITSFY